ncbi:hypothetical protein [Streptomyces sp. NPDC014676]|uniref:hypothetical protein n=1 Tax=Streptomyces sp. NPDC014676 TaxID=3364879 RepID=UPI0036F98D83
MHNIVKGSETDPARLPHGVPALSATAMSETEGNRMRFTRMAAGSTAIVTAALGLSLATAGPASAADGNWRAYGDTNPITSSSSTWKCGSTEQIATNVGAQVCAIRSASGTSVQGAVIVRNNTSRLVEVSATVILWNPSGSEAGTWSCSRSGVGANSWSVCFGETITKSGSVRASGATTAAGQTEGIGVSPYV